MTLGLAERPIKFLLKLGIKVPRERLHSYIVMTIKTNEDITNTVRAPVVTSLYLKLLSNNTVFEA